MIPSSDCEQVKKVLDGCAVGDTVSAHVFRPDQEGTGGTEFDITFKLEKDQSSFIETESK